MIYRGLRCLINFHKMFSFGHGYAEQQKANIVNPFWKELLQNWVYFCKCIKVDSIFTVLNSPFWFNNNLMNGDNFYIKDWYNKGIRYISDILDEHGNIYQFYSLKTRYNLRGTFLDFHLLLRKIPNEWKNILNNNEVVSILDKMLAAIYMCNNVQKKKDVEDFMIL